MERGRERARKEEDQIVRPSRRRKEKKKKKRQSNDYLVRDGDGGRVTAKHLELFRFTWSPCAVRVRHDAANCRRTSMVGGENGTEPSTLTIGKISPLLCRLVSII